MDWATFWAILSPTHLVTLAYRSTVYGEHFFTRRVVRKSRVARFFLVQNVNNIPIDHKLNQKAIKIPIGRKIFQMAINIITFSIPRPSKFYQNWDVWFENKPSGNPKENSFTVGIFSR
jgi:hypothetical protein